MTKEPQADEGGPATSKATSRFQRALAWATVVHEGQTRKGTTIPYISHPLGVASLVLEFGGTENEAIGALLHDSVEDNPDISVAEVEQRFGKAVADIVLGCSDSTEQPKPPFRERKEAYIAHLATADRSIRLVSLADKLYNARTILKDYQAVGERVWDRFTAGKVGTLWYYRELVGAFRGRDLPDALVDEFERVVSAIERKARGAGHGRGIFFHATALHHPEDLRDYLAKSYHWKRGYSAAELARAWLGADDIPAAVRMVLDADEIYRNAQLIEAFFEWQTKLETPGRASQTDLLAVVATGSGVAVLAVEGKCNESFGDIVAKWLQGRLGATPTDAEPLPTRQRRLDELCDVLRLQSNAVADLRYQLLHRTAAAVYEARRYRSSHAAVIVHSFSDPPYASFDDFAAFTRTLGVELTKSRPLAGACDIAGVHVRFAWVKDEARSW